MRTKKKGEWCIQRSSGSAWEEFSDGKIPILKTTVWICVSGAGQRRRITRSRSSRARAAYCRLHKRIWEVAAPLQYHLQRNCSQCGGWLIRVYTQLTALCPSRWVVRGKKNSSLIRNYEPLVKLMIRCH